MFSCFCCCVEIGVIQIFNLMLKTKFRLTFREGSAKRDALFLSLWSPVRHLAHYTTISNSSKRRKKRKKQRKNRSTILHFIAMRFGSVRFALRITSSGQGFPLVLCPFFLPFLLCLFNCCCCYCWLCACLHLFM